MNVTVFSPFVLWTPHFETDLELVQRHIDARDQVTLLACNGELPACDSNPSHETERCLACINRRWAGLHLLSRRVKVRTLSRYTPEHATAAELKTDFSDLQELKQYRIEEFDLGYAALSSLVSHIRDAQFSFREHGPLLRSLLRTSFVVYASTQEYLRQHDVDRVYVFNSRFAPTRGVLRACQKHHVECVVHDRGHDLQHFELYHNTFPHDRQNVDRCIRQLWQQAADHPQRNEIGAQWYRDKSQGIERKWFSFVSGQRRGLLPPNWDPTQRNVVIFVSSEDEFAAIGEGWENPIYESQLSGVRAIIQSLSSNPHQLQLYLRVHPNLAGVDNRQTRELMQLSAPFLTVIPAEADVSSYALLKNAEKILTFGSTVGIEAVFWGVPSILAGMSYYRDLGSTYNPANHEELVQLLQADLPAKGVEPALMYGYYFSSYGIPFQYFKATGVFDGQFKGKTFRLRRRLRALVRLRWHWQTMWSKVA